MPRPSAACGAASSGSARRTRRLPTAHSCKASSSTLCIGPQHIGQGWHSGATVGVFAGVAGAAAALRLPADKVVHALGIAGTQAAGLMAAQYGAMVKRMHAGRAAQSALYAALLAEQGFTGIADVFESPYGGFCTTFSGSRDKFDLAELTAGLGERFETMVVALKFY